MRLVFGSQADRQQVRLKRLTIQDLLLKYPRNALFSKPKVPYRFRLQHEHGEALRSISPTRQRYLLHRNDLQGEGYRLSPQQPDMIPVE